MSRDTMEMDRIEATALGIADEHGCHTVVLYGSYARGDAGDGSDVDLLYIRDAGPTLRDARVIDGVYFDGFVYPQDAFTTIDTALLRIVGGRVLRERDGAGTALLDRVRERFANGPDPLAADDRNMRIVWAHKMLGRAQSADGVEADYRRMSLILQALEDYFALRTLWFRGAKVAFPWLQLHDDAAYAAFETAARPAADHDALAALVNVVYGELPAG
jgi:predicted nucleotidyltransferase